MSFSHTQGSSSLTGGNSYTLFTLRRSSRAGAVWKLTRIPERSVLCFGQLERGDNAPSLNSTVGAMVKLGDSQTLQSANRSEAEEAWRVVDWQTSSLFTKRVTFAPASLRYEPRASELRRAGHGDYSIAFSADATGFVHQYSNGAQLVAQLRGRAALSQVRSSSTRCAPDIEISALSRKGLSDINLTVASTPESTSRKKAFKCE